MSFLAFFSGILNTSTQASDDIQAAVAELDIEKALMSHALWKSRLLELLEGDGGLDLDPSAICRDTECELGRWLHGKGAARIGNFQGFVALQDNHRMFHAAASNVVSLTQRGKTDAAKRMLDDQFFHFSAQVTRNLRALRALANRHAPRSAHGEVSLRRTLAVPRMSAVHALSK